MEPEDLIEQFDVIMNYPRVQQFLDRYGYEKHGAIVNDFLAIIRRNRGKEPEEIIRLLLRTAYRPEHRQVIVKYPDDAIHLAEYYIMWDRLPKEDRKIIQKHRWENSRKFRYHQTSS